MLIKEKEVGGREGIEQKLSPSKSEAIKKKELYKIEAET